VTLVQSTWDPYLIDYVLQHLQIGVNEVGGIKGNVTKARRIAAEKRVLRLLLQIPTLAASAQQQQIVQLQRARLESLRDRIQPLRELSRNTPEALSVQLESDDPEVRLAAIKLIVLHRPPLEAELIGLLNDQDRPIRREAHQALVRLARGTDLGPRPNADRGERLQSVRRWQTWLAMQDPPELAQFAKGRAAGGLAKDQARVAANQKGETKPVALRSTDAQAARLTAELLEAPADQQEQVLAKLKDAKGVVHTQALAAAIPQLGPEMQTKARDALAERLTRMTADTLRERLDDADPEIRRAAVLACALKGSRDHFPELVVLLGDSEPMVADAALTALKRLTKEDFGPKANATESEWLQAIAAWHAWWKQGGSKSRKRRDYPHNDSLESP